MNEFEDLPVLQSGLYRHYKGTIYRVLGVGCHTEVHEYYVVYAPAEPKGGIPQMWLRPYEMFIESVEVDGKTIPRFKRLED
jgi:hypothetical protein